MILRNVGSKVFGDDKNILDLLFGLVAFGKALYRAISSVRCSRTVD